MSGRSPAPHTLNPRRPLVGAAVAVLLMLLSLAGIRLSHRFAHVAPDTAGASASAEASDPRRTYNGPYRNIRPEVRYVGDAACVGCHDRIAHNYARHPMGRSLVSAKTLLDRLPTSPDVHNPFDALGRRFEVDLRDHQLRHRQALLDASGKPLLEVTQEVHWVIGSGAKGHSYLTQREGFVFQTPISWFAHPRRWDLSPGFGPEVLTGRLVPASCLFCHANGVHEHPEHPDRFVSPVFAGLAIGCERCHGPGELHVRSSDRWDIVNPERLPPPLRDAVCEQCHLEGETRVVRAGRKLFDYRPGLPLHDFWAVLVQERHGGEDARAVNHVEQMYQSKCFPRPVNGIKLGCITCHDPHIQVESNERQMHYRAACLKCHDETKGQQGCSEDPARRQQTGTADSCIDCHMPRYRSSDIAHTASTDHRIVRRPAQQPIRPADLETAVLVDFYRDRFRGGDAQAERSLGLGMVRMMDAGMLRPQRHADRALRFLEFALARDSADGSVRAGKVEAYLLLQRPSEALSEAELLLPQRPQDWQLLAQAAFAAQTVGQLDRAVDYWRRAVRINPFDPQYQVQLVGLLLRTGRRDEARRHCEQLLQLDPFNLTGRQAWVGFLLQDGNRTEAERAFERIRQLNPPDLAQREQWFQQQLR